jgi:hypothetical protein
MSVGGNARLNPNNGETEYQITEHLSRSRSQIVLEVFGSIQVADRRVLVLPPGAYEQKSQDARMGPHLLRSHIRRIFIAQ